MEEAANAAIAAMKRAITLKFGDASAWVANMISTTNETTKKASSEIGHDLGRLTAINADAMA